MIPEDILRKIRRVQITTAKKATDVFAGEYESVFKGRGLEFVEVREYIPGDPVRSIDWNVTARMNKPFIKKFIEEREINILFLLDLSRSHLFGSVNKLKRDLAAEVCAVLAASAVKNRDRVGLISFSDRVEVFLPPRKGTAHVFKLIREALFYKPRGKGTDMGAALRFLDRVINKRCVVFILSDFFTGSIKAPLSVTSRHHDLIAIHITDPRESVLPNAGFIELEDAETGGRYLINSSDPSVRARFQEIALNRTRQTERLFYSLGIDFMKISTGEPYEGPMMDFFIRRKNRIRLRGSG